MKSTVSELTDTVSGAVGDALSASTQFVHDVATTAAERATELASSAVRQVPDVRTHVVDVVDTARRRVRGQPRRRRPPWVAIFAAVAAIIAVGLVLKRRRAVPPSVDRGVDDGNNPARPHTARAAAAAGQ